MAIIVAVTSAAPAHARAEGGLSVSLGRGASAELCPDFKPAGTSTVRGGCTMPMRSRNMDVFVLSVVQDFVFSQSCDMDFVIHIDGEGHIAVDDRQVGGQSPCNDIVPCYETDKGAPPWNGYLHNNGGRILADFDICFDSCIARFEGMLVAELTRGEHGWKLKAVMTPLGDSGMQLDGSWTLPADDLNIDLSDEKGDDHEQG